MSKVHSSTSVEYRPIPGFPGYRVSSTGIVQSCWKRIGLGTGLGSKSKLGETWRTLKPGYSARRPTVVLCGPSGHVTKRVYVLVLIAFVGPCPPGMEACHDPDPDPSNCNLTNLRWDTRHANNQDGLRHGTTPIGSQCPWSKLTEGDVRIIRKRHRDGATQVALAREFQVHRMTIKHIVIGKIWKHVKEDVAHEKDVQEVS